MSNWTPADWVTFFAALGTFIGTTLGSLMVFLTKLAQLKKDISAQIAENTLLTKQGAAASEAVAKATNGLTEKIVSAELTAERIVAKAEIRAAALLDMAAKTANELANKVADKVAHELADKVKSA